MVLGGQVIGRRDFIKTTSSLVLLLATPTDSLKEQEKKRYAMLIDSSRCYGCMACVVTCAAENNVPIGFFRTWVERFVKPTGAVIFVPKQCNHCEDPPCVRPCPTRATFRDPNGLVLIDDNLCIGCGACVQACPYGARFPNPVKGTADKCTFCYHRLNKGLLPACVETCPTGARIFGSLTEENELKNIVESVPTQVLKPHANTRPMIFYMNLPEEANR
ncbi:MAG: 4Fe-4S dicluster domain-containing protein [Nitrososphaerota archaeon]